MTPMMKQYYELKATQPEAILFFRMGDFYEIFAEDAEKVSPLLQITMTSREKGEGQKVAFCGVPHHSAKGYWLKLLKWGFKVAIADQIEDPQQSKGLVKRAITRVYSPALIDELEGLDPYSPNYLGGLYEDPESRTWAIVVLDSSTGEFRLGKARDLAEAINSLSRFRPKEILTRPFFREAISKEWQALCGEQDLTWSKISEPLLRDPLEQKKLLREVLGSEDLSIQPSGDFKGATELAAAAFYYLHSLKSSLRPFQRVLALFESDRLELDETVIRDLELLETTRRRDIKGSLFHVINQCLSPMGARALRYEMLHPMAKSEAIETRQEAVAFLVKTPREQFERLLNDLRGLPDLMRLKTRAQNFTLSPQESLKILAALTQAQSILNDLEAMEVHQNALLSEIAKQISILTPLKTKLEAALNPEASLVTGSFDLFKFGIDRNFDQSRDLALRGSQAVSAYEAEIRQSTGIASLKVKEHKSFGLLIEVSKSNLNKVPGEFERRQTMVNGERFITPALRELEQSLIEAKSSAQEQEQKLFSDLLKYLCGHSGDLEKGAHAIAQIDLLQSLAILGREHRYIRPQVGVRSDLNLRASRHPVLEKILAPGCFTPNVIYLSQEKPVILITGPNMAGKSTAMRQVALTAILAQMGSFVPAEAATLPIFDRIFTRVGASDDMAKGQSTFMVEMAETAHILRFATSRSLVLLDEIGRGTSTQDGLAIASAILEELALGIRPMTLFATHFHELVPFGAQLEAVRPVQTEVSEGPNGLKFSHKLIEGAASSSFGLEAARIAGVPSRVLERAQALLSSGHSPH